MEIQSLGHVVLKVRNQERAEAFYGGVLGFPIVAREEGFGMTFFSFGNHHDFAILAVGDDADAAAENAVGLFHAAFKIGDTLAELKEAKAHLEGSGIAVVASDHDATQSIYFDDPDGNALEFYVDASDEWKRDPGVITTTRPLEL